MIEINPQMHQFDQAIISVRKNRVESVLKAVVLSRGMVSLVKLTSPGPGTGKSL